MSSVIKEEIMSKDILEQTHKVYICRREIMAQRNVI